MNGCDESAGPGPSKLREETARDPSRLPSHTRERVEVVQGSHGGIDVGTKAFAGADSVFWLVLPDPHAESVEAAYVDFTRPACDAFKSQGVRRVAGVWAPGPRGSLRVADLRGGPPGNLVEQAEGVFQVEAVQERFASLGRGPAQVPRSGP